MSSALNSNAPVHGNYHSYAFLVKDILFWTQLSDRYYSKRPFASDFRLGALPEGIFHGATVLDIGCNEGWVTCEIGNRLPSSVPTFKLTVAVLCESKLNPTAPVK
jgi:hypothetical protein